MEWGGKLVGGAVGLLVAGPVGAALGVLAGHLVDDKIETTRSSSRKAPPRPAKASGASKPRVTTRQAEHGTRPSTLHHIEDTDPFANAAFDAESEESPAVEDPEAVASQFFQITFEVMGHVAKCDGRVSESDIRAARAVMKDFELTDTQIAQAIGHFNAGKASHYDVERSVMGLRRVCAGRPDLPRTFLEIQVRVAIIGSDLQGPARPLLTRVATILGVGGLEFAQLETLLRIRYRARGNRGDAADWNRPADGVHEPPAAEAGGAGERGARSGSRGRAGDRSPPSPMRMTLQEAYQVLAVMPGEPMQVITRAYRRQLSRHHPDKLKANGLPESMLGFAQQQTQLVIEAYNIIRESRGEPT